MSFSSEALVHYYIRCVWEREGLVGYYLPKAEAGLQFDLLPDSSKSTPE